MRLKKTFPHPFKKDVPAERLYRLRLSGVKKDVPAERLYRLRLSGVKKDVPAERLYIICYRMRLKKTFQRNVSTVKKNPLRGLYFAA